MTVGGVLEEGLRSLDPEDAEAVDRAKRHARYVVDKFKKEYEPKFEIWSCVLYYR